MCKRERWIDVAKGIAILAVVVGHVIGGLQNSGIIQKEDLFANALIFVVYKFHMPVFLFFSGYCYKKGSICTLREYVAYFKKNVINLGIPYVVFSAVYILMNYAIATTIGGVNTTFGVKHIIQIWYKPVAQYWFLYVLLGLKLLTPAVDIFFRQEAVYVFCVISELVYKLFVEEHFPVQGLPLYLIGYSSYYCLGLLCRNKKLFLMQFIKPRIAMIGIVSIMDLLFNWIFLKEIPIGVNIINNQFIAALLIADIAYISKGIEINISAETFLERCGRYSMYIFLLHVFPCAFLRIIMIKIGIVSPLIQAFGGTAVGIYTCLVIAVFAEKRPLLNIVFYPKKSYDKLKCRGVR